MKRYALPLLYLFVSTLFLVVALRVFDTGQWLLGAVLIGSSIITALIAADLWLDEKHSV